MASWYDDDYVTEEYDYDTEYSVPIGEEQEFRDFLEEFWGWTDEDQDNFFANNEQQDEDFYNTWVDEYEEGEDQLEEEVYLDDEEVDNLVSEIFADQEDYDVENNDEQQDNYDQGGEYNEDNEEQGRYDEGEEQPWQTAALESGGSAPIRLGATIDTSDAVSKVKDGFNSVKNIVGGVTKKLDKLGVTSMLGGLSSVYSMAKCIVEIRAFFIGESDDSPTAQLKKELQKIVDELKVIDSTLKKGFSSLIAHMDKMRFEETVLVPTEIIFDRMMECFEMTTEEAFDEFKEGAKGSYKPSDILSRLKVYLGTVEGIISTQLTHNDYSYETYKKWYDMIMTTSLRLAICNVFYYGLIAKSASESVNAAMSHTRNMIGKIVHYLNCLERIDDERMKQFHQKGHAAKLLQKTFIDKCEEPYPGDKDFGTELLTKAATKLKKEWIEVNGPRSFYIAIVRGKMDEDYQNNSAHIYNGDDTRVTVVKNAAYGTSSDAISLVLVQPVTAEMISAHESQATSDTEDKVVKLMSDNFRGYNLQNYVFGRIRKGLIEMHDKKPLLIMWSMTKHGVSGRDLAPTKTDKIYRVLGEASTASAEKLRSHKFNQIHEFAGGLYSSKNIPLRFVLSMIWQ